MNDDCIEYEPRSVKRLRAMQYIEEVHRDACWLGFRFGVGFTLWLGGLVGFACWLAVQ